MNKTAETGIYGIRGLIKTEEGNFPWYIGKTENYSKRGNFHRWILNENRHHSKYLQNYFNKYGIFNLEFNFLLACDFNQLNDLEIEYIKKYDSYNNGFNMTLGGDGGSKKPCALQNIETGEIFSTDSIQEFAKIKQISNSTGLGASLSGKQNYSSGWFNPNGEWKPKFYKIKDPNGQIFSFHNIAAFATQQGLQHSAVHAVIIGKSDSTHGWTRIEGKPAKEFKSLEYSFIDPNGKIFQGKNVNKLARQFNLDGNTLRDVLHGRISQHYGWRKHEDGQEIKKFIPKIYSYKLISPQGEVFEISNLSEFARKNNLEAKNLFAVLKNKRKSCYGWTKA